MPRKFKGRKPLPASRCDRRIQRPVQDDFPDLVRYGDDDTVTRPRKSGKPKPTPLPLGAVSPHRCRSCGADMVLNWSPLRKRYYYRCDSYPRCLCIHGAHSDGRPMSSPASQETKLARSQAHDAFDRLWRGKTRVMSRYSAYGWLAIQLKIAPSECHIGYFDLEMCRRVIERSAILMSLRSQTAWMPRVLTVVTSPR